MYNGELVGVKYNDYYFLIIYDDRHTTSSILKLLGLTLDQDGLDRRYKIEYIKDIEYLPGSKDILVKFKIIDTGEKRLSNMLPPL